MVYTIWFAVQTFQRFMDAVLRGLNFCHDYIDDIFVASKNEEEHQRYLKQVFQRLQKYGLSIDSKKQIRREGGGIPRILSKQRARYTISA